MVNVNTCLLTKIKVSFLFFHRSSSFIADFMNANWELTVSEQDQIKCTYSKSSLHNVCHVQNKEDNRKSKQ